MLSVVSFLRYQTAGLMRSQTRVDVIAPVINARCFLL